MPPKKGQIKYKVLSLKQLKAFFDSYDYKENSLVIDQCTVIIDLKKCVNSYIDFLEAHPGNKGFFPYYNHLTKIHSLLK